MMCSVNLGEVINSYTEENSKAYCCILHASKAFDKVHNGTDYVLSKKCVKIWRLIIISTRQVDNYI